MTTQIKSIKQRAFYMAKVTVFTILIAAFIAYVAVGAYYGRM
jgi:hypothetical protein